MKQICRIRYNEEEDSFELEISNDGGKTWGLDVGCKCMPVNGCTEYIHFSIINALKSAVLAGYKFTA